MQSGVLRDAANAATMRNAHDPDLAYPMHRDSRAPAGQRGNTSIDFILVNDHTLGAMKRCKVRRDTMPEKHVAPHAAFKGMHNLVRTAQLKKNVRICLDALQLCDTLHENN